MQGMLNVPRNKLVALCARNRIFKQIFGEVLLNVPEILYISLVQTWIIYAQRTLYAHNA